MLKILRILIIFLVLPSISKGQCPSWEQGWREVLLNDSISIVYNGNGSPPFMKANIKFMPNDNITVSLQYKDTTDYFIGNSSNQGSWWIGADSLYFIWQGNSAFNAHKTWLNGNKKSGIVEMYSFKGPSHDLQQTFKITYFPKMEFAVGNNINDIVKCLVEKEINKWQQKGEFEKTQEYMMRVSKDNRLKKIAQLQEKNIDSLEEHFINYYWNKTDLTLGSYDADNETFLIESEYGDFVLPVPLEKAAKFKESFEMCVTAYPEFVIINDRFILSHLTYGYPWKITPTEWKKIVKEAVRFNLDTSMQFMDSIASYYGIDDNWLKNPKNDSNVLIFTYDMNDAPKHANTNITYEFAEIELPEINSSTKTSAQIRSNNIRVGSSVVDLNIPTNSKVDNRYAIVIGNEDYSSFQRNLESEQNVDYASHDAEVFKNYCLNTLGVKKENMNFLINATAGSMNQKINKVLKLMEKLGPEGELVIYYAGHGFPDEQTKEPYLIPVDVSGTDLSYAVKLHDLYKKLGNTGAKITVFLDACFTGSGRNAGLLAARGIRVKPKQEILNGNVVVFSASSGEQSALPYHQEGHGLFTYYLLEKLQESEGDISYGDLADYINSKVSVTSINVNEKEQDPVVNTSEKVADSWRNWSF